MPRRRRGALAREIERLSRREDVSAILGDLRHTVGPAATLTRAELRQRLAAFDVDGDGVLEASEALDAARALGGDDEDRRSSRAPRSSAPARVP